MTPEGALVLTEDGTVVRRHSYRPPAVVAYMHEDGNFVIDSENPPNAPLLDATGPSSADASLVLRDDGRVVIVSAVGAEVGEFEWPNEPGPDDVDVDEPDSEPDSTSGTPTTATTTVDPTTTPPTSSVGTAVRD